MTQFKVTILGCGSSGGVPLINGHWGACDPSEPKNRRRRASLMIETETTCVLVDAGPDVRAQLLDYKPKKIDALILTHDHADHTHGLDDLRFMIYDQEINPLPVYMGQETERSLHLKFPYLFSKTSSNPMYPALYSEVLVDGEFTIGDLDFQSWLQPHGLIQSMGLRVGDFAYSTDAVDLTEKHFRF
ncbi:MAG: MBL fold metallo-hydrolase, partial [Alphaproteobacteria bacterium]